MIALVLASAFFVGIHVFVSGTALRGAIVARTGENAFRGLFSLASLAGIVWLSGAYAAAPWIELWQPAEALRVVALLLVPIAFVLVVAGLTTPSPTAIGGEARRPDEAGDPARGILRVTRHPFLWGVAIWATAHLLTNGDAASAILFGSLLALALIGPALIDGKRRAARGPGWERFESATSNLPFGAIASGRNRLVLGEIGAVRLLAALALFALALAAHRALFGVSPYP